MGEVYRARDTRLGRDVAVKVLTAALAADPERLARFEREARAVAALSHPNIIAVFDIGHERIDGGGETTFVVTELLEGHTLRERLVEGPTPVRKAIDIGRQIAEALAAAHERGIVHRDLKPENVFVTNDGRVKVLDFGLAQMAPVAGLDMGQTIAASPHTIGTTPGTILGTVGYMAPEQLRGQPVDARADIFALGALLYELLTRERAFHGDSSADAISAILNAEPAQLPRVAIIATPAIERIVRRCLEKSPAERFQSADELVGALDTCRRRQRAVGAAEGRVRRARPPVCRSAPLPPGSAGRWRQSPSASSCCGAATRARARHSGRALLDSREHRVVERHRVGVAGRPLHCVGAPTTPGASGIVLRRLDFARGRASSRDDAGILADHVVARQPDARVFRQLALLVRDIPPERRGTSPTCLNGQPVWPGARTAPSSSAPPQAYAQSRTLAAGETAVAHGNGSGDLARPAVVPARRRSLSLRSRDRESAKRTRDARRGDRQP